MHLSDLILLSNRLEHLTLDDLRQESLARFNRIMHETDVAQAGVDPNFRTNLDELNLITQTSFQNLDKELERYRQEVHQLIDQEGVKWFQTSSARYEQRLETRNAQQPEAIEAHHNKPIVLDEETAKVLKTRVSYYADWRYPAMVIHPMQESFIHDMVSNDPLYLVAESHYLLQPALDNWQDNDVFRNRLRVHIIEESFDQPILDKLPDGQIGFCLVYNYLNYRPYEIIKKYLEELYEKLKPGGVVALTFNDCDRHEAMQLVEQGITYYTPGSLLKGWAKYVGFEEIFEHRDNSASVWIELKKPGTLSTLRGGQALAKILPKPVA
jgi:SAM-dependent methyltransferase